MSKASSSKFMFELTVEEAKEVESALAVHWDNLENSNEDNSLKKEIKITKRVYRRLSKAIGSLEA